MQEQEKGKAPVVYYLSRNGQLEHPHFMEVPLSSSPHGLHLRLRDVLHRLDLLRGKGMASMYAWSSKRSYKNGFVWQDLSEDDRIHPVIGCEYVLKGSEIACFPEIPKSDSDLPLPVRRRKTRWSSIDLGEYRVWKNELTAEDAANAATQTDERRRVRPEEDEELATDEISPPAPSSSTEEAVESLVKGDGGCRSGGIRASASASAIVMHLISCGSFSLAPQNRGMPPRGGAEDDQETKEIPSFSVMRLEHEECFSSSLVEVKKKKKKKDEGGVFPALKRSSSCKAEGGGGRSGGLAERARAQADQRCPRK